MKHPLSTAIAPLAATAIWLAACAGPADQAPAPGTAAPADGGETPRVAWALAIHGGAGTIPKTLPEEQQRAYFPALESALTLGRDALERGDASLEVIEQVVRLLEDSPLFNAGKGAVFTHDGRHELDAAIMDGATLRAGAVAALTTVRHPISLARLVSERTEHVFLVGAGAESFADDAGVERVANEWFDTPHRREAGEKANGKFGTVGAVALDRRGRLAAATSSGGLTNKRWGRIGDVPILGAGTWADDRVAVSCTGKGEEFIRHAVASQVAQRMRFAGQSLTEATRATIFDELPAEAGGLIAVGADGSIAMTFSTSGMYRAAADSGGRFEVGIWSELDAAPVAAAALAD